MFSLKIMIVKNFIQKRKKTLKRKKLLFFRLEEYEEIMELLKRKSSNDEFIITDEMLERTRERTYRYLRHRELLLEFSSASSVVLMYKIFKIFNF